MNFTDQNFQTEVLKSEKSVLVDFFAQWCGPCKALAPIIEELEKEYQGKAKVGSLDVDENMQTSTQYQVMSIPTLIIFKNGQAVERLIGLQSKKLLKDKLDNLL